MRYAEDGPGPARTDHPSTPPSTSSPAPPKPRSTPETCAGAEAAAVADRLGIVPPGTLGGLAAAFEGRYDDARDLLKAAAGRCGPGAIPPC